MLTKVVWNVVAEIMQMKLQVSCESFSPNWFEL